MSEVGASAMDTMPGTFAVGFGLTPEPVHAAASFTAVIADGQGFERIDWGGAATAGLRGAALRRARPGQVAPLAVLAGRCAGPPLGGCVGAT